MSIKDRPTAAATARSGGGGMRLSRALLTALVAMASWASFGAVAHASEFDGPIIYVPNGDGVLHAYQEGTWTEVGSWQMPFTGPIRGSDADASGGFLYVAYGGDGGEHGTGSLIKWNLRTDSTVWNRSYPFGVDQFANCDGRIYMPVGEAETGGVKIWKILDAGTGDIVGSLTAGTRPFTVNAADTRAWITWTRFRGFSIANSRTGQILATRNFGPVPSSFKGNAPSHGISLAPDGSEVYVLDASVGQVQVYSGSDDPQFLATVPLAHTYTGMVAPCFYDCVKEGWLLHSGDGRYVFAGEAGDVIDTQTRAVVATLPALTNDRHGFIEVNWSDGAPAATTSHFGIGR